MHRREEIINDLAENGYEGKDCRSVLSALICCCMPYSDADKLADKLCADNKSLSNIVDIPKEQLVEKYGLDDAAAILINNIPDIVFAYRRQNIGQVIQNISSAREYFKEVLAFARVETLVMCFLDDDLRVVSCDVINYGNVDSVGADPVNIIKAADRAGCKLAFIAHNHPVSGAVPSNEDILVTNSVKLILSRIGIRLLDHIIVSGSGETYSMKTRGHIPLVDTLS